MYPGVTKACWYDPEINPSYLELARHFNTVVLPARPRYDLETRRPPRWGFWPWSAGFWPRFATASFYSLAELNEAIVDQGGRAELPECSGASPKPAAATFSPSWTLRKLCDRCPPLRFQVGPVA